MQPANDASHVDAGASKPERLDFLRQVIAFNEANVRTYDIKAQISLAAFVLSGNPLIAIVVATCGQGAVRIVLVSILTVFIITILAYLWVLWPTSPPRERLTAGIGAQDLFYLRDPLRVGGPDYAARIKTLAVEPELTAEAIKLSYIRLAKARRFKVALAMTLLAYGIVIVVFFGLGRCAF